MRPLFYIKIFLTFILFFILLLSYTFYSFNGKNSFYKTNNSEQRVETTIEEQEFILLNFISTYEEKLNMLEIVFRNYLSDEVLKIFIENTILQEKEILEIRSLCFDSKDRFVFDNVNKEFKRLKTNYTKDYYKNLRTLKKHEKYSFLDSKDKSIINIAIRGEHEFFILKIDTKVFLEKRSKTYFTNSKILTQTEYENGEYKDFNIKKIYINSNEYFVILVRDQNNILKEFYLENIFTISLVSIFLSFLFASIATLIIAKENKKIEKENQELDITNQKNNIRLDKSSEIMDRYILYLRVDNQGIINDVSSAFSDFLGFSRSELLGQKYQFIVKSNLKRVVNTIIAKSSKNKPIKLKRIKGVKKDGEIFFLDVFVEVTTIKNKRYFNIICQDNTNKLKIEELYNNLNNQVELYNSIFENVQSGIAILDAEYNIVKVNRQLELFLGYKENELYKSQILNLIEKDSKSGLAKLFIELKELINISKIEKIFIRKDGQQIHLELSLKLLREKNQIIFIVNSLEDKRELQELNLNLEARIEEELEKSKAKDKIHLEEQIKSARLSYIGAMAAGITHEINTPLTYVKGNLELMQYDLNDLEESESKQRMLLDSKKMKDGINRIANIVESMREVTHSKTANKEKINVCQTIVTSLTMAHNRAKHIGKIYLNNRLLNFDEDLIIKNPIYIFGQKQKLEQVWIIIINNALDELEKIAEYENRWLKIEVTSTEDNINIKFKDNAGGIPKEAMKKLFEPFNSQKEKGGMGIGLSIAKNIIEENGGSIDGYNDEFGAIFEVNLEKYKENN
ncbi:PAS domain-containing sensor histidine kinase [Arcobacter porcinus]|uniref:histidine kinase n=1 Tax=Arcobacter porcinus TaxID=1935204 RepID=A0A5C2HJ68_9BACT|nr:PAS domain S-box protein [Arcobacter porcinus]OCL83759.1 C4-dicarboxylate transport sensor protein DctB [Arcobacter porcinus]OCL94392.1 C4-dicarboxylate transport sensor protein DctB [Aliarcobacter thereius]QEP41261.1 PAS sensor-containing two-component system histidine kinase [Arcobacter porcinus]